MKPAKTNFVPTKAALAKRIGVSLPTLDAYLKRPGAPQQVVGFGYDFDAVVEFISANGSRTETAKAAPDLRALKVEELTLKCAKLKFSLDRERGLYRLGSDVDRQWLAHIQQARSILFACPSELAPAVHGLPVAEIEIRIMERMDAAIAALASNPLGGAP